MSQIYGGMTYDQVRMAGESVLIEVGAHTKTHPYLNSISKDEQEHEIIGSNDILSGIIGRPVRYLPIQGENITKQHWR